MVFDAISGPSSPEEDSTEYLFCKRVEKWAVQAGYITEHQLPHASSIMLMMSSDIEGADLRVVIDRSPLEDMLGKAGYGLKLRFGSSDQAIGKSTMAISPANARITGFEGTRYDLLSHAETLEGVLDGERPVGVDIRLSYPSPDLNIDNTNEAV